MQDSYIQFDCWVSKLAEILGASTARARSDKSDEGETLIASSPIDDRRENDA
jgi:hypothetical protein